jgi:hypothetical protein
MLVPAVLIRVDQVQWPLSAQEHLFSLHMSCRSLLQALHVPYPLPIRVTFLRSWP